MAIWGFFGSLGSGKDSTANYFLNIKSKKGRKIVTHVKLTLPHEYLTIDEIFNKAVNDTQFFRDKILYISEFQLLMDARRSSASVNVDFSQNILIQLGKLDCDFFYTCQLLSQMDLRIKEMQKYFLFCNKVFRLTADMFVPIQYQGRLTCVYDEIEWDKRIVKNPITQELIPFDIDLNILTQDGERVKNEKAMLPWEALLEIFNNYDTREIIKFNRSKYLK